jgi:hypothetical protein
VPQDCTAHRYVATGSAAFVMQAGRLVQNLRHWEHETLAPCSASRADVPTHEVVSQQTCKTHRCNMSSVQHATRTCAACSVQHTKWCNVHPAARTHYVRTHAMQLRTMQLTAACTVQMQRATRIVWTGRRPRALLRPKAHRLAKRRAQAPRRPARADAADPRAVGAARSSQALSTDAHCSSPRQRDSAMQS